MHDSLFRSMSTKTAINGILYCWDNQSYLSILVRLAKKCFRGVTIPDVPIGMRDKRHHVISVLCTQRRPLTRSDQAL